MKAENKSMNKLFASKVKGIHMKIIDESILSKVNEIHTKVNATVEDQKSKETAADQSEKIRVDRPKSFEKENRQ